LTNLSLFVQELYGTTEFIPLHSPRFDGNEKKYLLQTIDSTFVSSVGHFVDTFEQGIADFTGVNYAIATVNGTAALHIALRLAGVEPGTEVITQSLTFVATCNAIRYCGALPVFVDVDRSTLGLSPESLEEFMEEHCEVRDDGHCWNKSSNRRIAACLPMHTFGFPVELNKIKELCDRFHIEMVEDSAESLGSRYRGKHTGNIGKLAILSFNGNKIITTGGGGIILTNDEIVAARAKHITTVAKVVHRWNIEHDELGYNYRLPNLNAALGVAQLEMLPSFIENKRCLAKKYQEWGTEYGLEFVVEPEEVQANYWLNTVVCANRDERDDMLKVTNENNVMTRPVWTPMHRLAMNMDSQKAGMEQY